MTVQFSLLLSFLSPLVSLPHSFSFSSPFSGSWPHATSVRCVLVVCTEHRLMCWKDLPEVKESNPCPLTQNHHSPISIFHKKVSKRPGLLQTAFKSNVYFSLYKQCMLMQKIQRRHLRPSVVPAIREYTINILMYSKPLTFPRIIDEDLHKSPN